MYQTFLILPLLAVCLQASTYELGAPVFRGTVTADGRRMSNEQIGDPYCNGIMIPCPVISSGVEVSVSLNLQNLLQRGESRTVQYDTFDVPITMTIPGSGYAQLSQIANWQDSPSDYGYINLADWTLFQFETPVFQLGKESLVCVLGVTLLSGTYNSPLPFYAALARSAFEVSPIQSDAPPSQVPEPATAGFAAAGLLSLAVARCRYCTANALTRPVPSRS